MLPEVLDERSKALLREFGEINGAQVRRPRAGDDAAGERSRGADMAKKTERGKAYFMISAVSQKYDIHPQTLRLYEREGLLTPSRTEGNTRLYSEEDLEQLETILSLTRELGVNLAGVEIILNMRRKIERMQGEVNEFMDYVKRELARGIDDWEQRLSTAMVKSGPTDLVRRAPAAQRLPAADEDAGRARARALIAWPQSGLLGLKAKAQGGGFVTPRRSFLTRGVTMAPWLRALRRHRMEDDRRRRCRARHALRLRPQTAPAIAWWPTRASRSAISTARSTTTSPTTNSSRRRCSTARGWPTGSRWWRRARCCRGCRASARRISPSPTLLQMIRTRGARGLFYDTRDLLRVIRATYDPVNRTAEMDVLGPVMRADVLVLDDLGAEKTSEWVEETMNLIVNTRYSEKRLTIFTTNYDDNPDITDPDSLLFRIGARMRSRLHEMCEGLYLSGADYRELPPNGGVDELMTLWKMRAQGAQAAAAGRTGGQARAQLRERDGKADLKWSGGRAGSVRMSYPSDVLRLRRARPLRSRPVLRRDLQLLQLQSRPVPGRAEGSLRDGRVPRDAPAGAGRAGRHHLLRRRHAVHPRAGRDRRHHPGVPRLVRPRAPTPR